MFEHSITRVLPIHFNLPRHVIPLQTFIDTAESTARIANYINRDIFGGAFTLEVVIIPPEEGTFLSKLGIAVLAVSTFVAANIASGPLSDFGSGVFEELFDGDASDYGKQLVQVLKGTLSDLTSGTEDKQLRCEAAATATTALTQWFLQEDNQIIAELPIASAFTAAMPEKKRFYEACREVADLQSIGFTEAPSFPIKREDFQNLSKLPESVDELGWEVRIENITGTSPNWNRQDSARKWKGFSSDGHPRYYTIHDDVFWDLVGKKELDPKIADSMKVQWAYQVGPRGRKNHRVLSVLEFNGKPVSKPKTSTELRIFLDQHKQVKDLQASLFD